MTNPTYSLIGKVTDPPTGQVAYIEIPSFSFEEKRTLDQTLHTLKLDATDGWVYRMVPVHPQAELLQLIARVIHDASFLDRALILDKLAVEAEVPTEQEIYDALLLKL